MHTWGTGLAREFVRVVAAVVVAVAAPILENAPLVGALVLVGLAAGQAAPHLVRLVGAVKVSVADGVLRDAFAVHASGLVDPAGRRRTCRRLGNYRRRRIQAKSYLLVYIPITLMVKHAPKKKTNKNKRNGKEKDRNDPSIHAIPRAFCLVLPVYRDRMGTGSDPHLRGTTYC